MPYESEMIENPGRSCIQFHIDNVFQNIYIGLRRKNETSEMEDLAWQIMCASYWERRWLGGLSTWLQVLGWYPAMFQYDIRFLNFICK